MYTDLVGKLLPAVFQRRKADYWAILEIDAIIPKNCARIGKKPLIALGRGGERDGAEADAGDGTGKGRAASGMRPFVVDDLQEALCEQTCHLAQRGLEGDAAHLKVGLFAGDAHCVANKLACEVDGVVEAAAGVDGGA